jgi:hypothetical protein
VEFGLADGVELAADSLGRCLNRGGVRQQDALWRLRRRADRDAALLAGGKSAGRAPSCAPAPTLEDVFVSLTGAPARCLNDLEETPLPADAGSLPRVRARPEAMFWVSSFHPLTAGLGLNVPLKPQDQIKLGVLEGPRAEAAAPFAADSHRRAAVGR